MLPDSAAVGPAPHAVAPRTATAAATTVPEATAAARAAVEDRARAEPDHDHATTARACAEPMQIDATSSGDGRTSKEDVGNGDDIAAFKLSLSDDVAVPMDVDFGTRCPVLLQQPLQPPQQLRVGNKRRRLDADDGDAARSQAELRHEEDEAGVHAPVLRLLTASAHPASVLAVYAHNASRFDCTLCVFTASSFASLKRHRDSRHRRTAFLDRFSAGCTCGVPFTSRLAAARHAQACASLSSTPLATASTTAGASSPTDAGAGATVAAAVQAEPDLPRQDSTELAASPQLVSPTNVEVADVAAQATGAEASAKRWGPPLPRVLVASRIAGRLSTVPPPPLPRTTVAARIATRIAATPAPRWGPPLPRSVVVSRIANRLILEPPGALAEGDDTKDSEPMDWTAAWPDEETKESEPPAAAPVLATEAVRDPANTVDDLNGEWLLRFDGACRANPGPGGAGAALFKPSGPVVWTCSHYDPSSNGTNNTAEYTALLLGARAAADHGVKKLRVEGDSTLVIQQVRGIFATRSTRLRALRNKIKLELTRVGSFSLHHIDRQANGHADRLANAGLDRRRTKLECSVHADGNGCTSTSVAATTSTAPEAAAAPRATPTPAAAPATPNDHDTDAQGDIDDGEVYAAMCVGPDAVPQRRPRLRLRKLTDEEDEEAGAMVDRLSAKLAAKITDANDWETAEGYITALPYILYDKLQPYAQLKRGTTQNEVPQRQRHQQSHDRGAAQASGSGATTHGQTAPRSTQRRRRRGGRRHRHRQRPTGAGSGGTRQQTQRQPRPPRVTRHHREHRIDEALDDLHVLERMHPHDRPAINKARRRVGRIRSAINQHLLRHRFDTAEKACVDDILAAARARREAMTASTAAPTAAVDDGKCPIPGDELWRFFDEVNTPQQVFDAEAPEGAAFREAMTQLTAATRSKELLTEAPTVDDIEDQLQRVRGSSSPGLDVGAGSVAGGEGGEGVSLPAD
ncbi:hypothetical protein PI125_g24064 [Phytophthora idaei]|nr:hypothetical protein PI125_g24064 [Phytophthora idaei]